MDGQVALYFESAAVITVLVLLGQLLEARARGKTGSAIGELLDLAPKTALKVAGDGSELEIPVDDIELGDTLRVRPGDKVPADGIIVEGESRLEEAMITGEPDPVRKSSGDHVIGATVNGSGSFMMRVRRPVRIRY